VAENSNRQIWRGWLRLTGRRERADGERREPGMALAHARGSVSKERPCLRFRCAAIPDFYTAERHLQNRDREGAARANRNIGKSG
jgi:hypothetical protein